MAHTGGSGLPKPNKTPVRKRKDLPKRKPMITIRIYDNHISSSVADMATVQLMNIIVNQIPLEMRKMIAVAGENNDIIERILIRACSKTLRTGRPF